MADHTTKSLARRELLVELRRFRHLADVECVRSQFVQRHQGFSFIDLYFALAV
jgi:hypothetical protein